jgi:hypothetical protein
MVGTLCRWDLNANSHGGPVCGDVWSRKGILCFMNLIHKLSGFAGEFLCSIVSAPFTVHWSGLSRHLADTTMNAMSVLALILRVETLVSITV